jgi:hypothetical protein
MPLISNTQLRQEIRNVADRPAPLETEDLFDGGPPNIQALEGMEILRNLPEPTRLRRHGYSGDAPFRTFGRRCGPPETARQ